MQIAILSRNSKLHSIRRLRQEGKKIGLNCQVIDPLDCQLVIQGKENRIILKNRPLPHYDAVLPRIGASITDYGLSVVRHFEMQKTLTINSSKAIAESRDKMRSLQVLTSAGLLVPATVLSHSTESLRKAVESVKGFPVVLKVLRGTQGVGVMLVETPVSLGSVMDTLRALEQVVIIQQFIAKGAGRDYRAFVVGDRIIAAMLRVAPKGEFRSNIHRGGSAKIVRLSPAFERAALRAAKTLRLPIAGVDLMDSEEGPMIIEVNSSPGFEGIEKATGINVAGAIAKYIKTTVRASRK